MQVLGQMVDQARVDEERWHAGKGKQANVQHVEVQGGVDSKKVVRKLAYSVTMPQMMRANNNPMKVPPNMTEIITVRRSTGTSSATSGSIVWGVTVVAVTRKDRMRKTELPSDGEHAGLVC